MLSSRSFRYQRWQMKPGAEFSPLMRLVTYNLRYDPRPDNITVQQLDALPDPLVLPGYQRRSGEPPWSLRRQEHALRPVALSRGGTGGQKLTVPHLDDRSEAQRRHAASMVLARARYEATTTGCPVFTLGEFNNSSMPSSRQMTLTRSSPPEGRDAGAYEIATGARAPDPLPADFAAKYALFPNSRCTTSA
ncbi:hypothetical protein GGX14DRAFT_588245 [Mycena pura]|uniref:Uncharacterized protein n=1 Tax=Mycena pura TaxID=153505 RepID=A0AAD6Y6K4_9AGAR|nr:hypothetical protein GGX14DRAFT_588245 [Mycena pura]